MTEEEARQLNHGGLIGAGNLARVREWYLTHLGGTRTECAADLGLSVTAVGRHVKKLRSEWEGDD